MKCNVRESEIQDVQNGDVIYYKKYEQSVAWSWDSDGKQIIVKHDFV